MATDAKLVFKVPATGSAGLVFGWQPDAPVGTPGRLVFCKPATGSGRLVFGDDGAPPPAAPNVVFGIDADLPGLGQLLLRTGAALGLDADFPGLGTLLLRTGAVMGMMDASLPNFEDGMGLQWDANVSRGGIRHELGSYWQQAQPTASALQMPWQQAQAMRISTAMQWQAGQRTHAGVQASWQQAQALRHATQQHWQAGQALRHAVRQHWQEATRLRTATGTGWQQAELLRHAVRLHYEEAIRLRHAARQHWQNASGLRAGTHPAWGHGIFSRTGLRTHWQEAMRPRAGVETKPPPPKPPSCRNPRVDAGYLLFDRTSSHNGLLLFVCHRGGPVLPPATVVVPAQRTYIMINSIEIRRADNLSGDPLPSESFSMSLNRQSWTWQFSAAFHASAREALTPGLGGQPVELEVRVNGQPFRLQAERIGRSRKFAEHIVTVSGRGKAALLDAPHAAVQTFSQPLERTAHQLMTEVLTVNGVGFGWSVDWNLTDWLVPGGAWMHQGTWITALADIAASVGGYLQPHATDSVIRVLPSWPKPWWEWGTLTPDIELPDGIAEVDETEVIDQPDYDRIFVSGEARGVLADLTRSGLPGTVLKQPMAVHPLITHMDAARQRAIAELSESGRALKHRMTLPVLPQTGIITPGMVLRYADDAAVQRLGIVRATNLQQQWPVLTQTLELDSHV